MEAPGSGEVYPRRQRAVSPFFIATVGRGGLPHVRAFDGNTGALLSVAAVDPFCQEVLCTPAAVAR